MAVRSVYLPYPSIRNDRIQISGDEHRHLRVARVQAGEVIEIFDGKGGAWTASVDSVNKQETVARVLEYRTVPPSPVELILGLAIFRTAAFEWALEKVVEVGVTRIVPFRAGRSNPPLSNRHDRWQRILIEAAKQSKQYYLPALQAPVGFKDVLSMSASSRIMFAERSGGPLKSALAGSPVLALIGPEGGWTDEELSAARDHGFHAVSLGPAILKAETAAIVGTALIRHVLSENENRSVSD